MTLSKNALVISPRVPSLPWSQFSLRSIKYLPSRKIAANGSALDPRVYQRNVSHFPEIIYEDVGKETASSDGIDLKEI